MGKKKEAENRLEAHDEKKGDIEGKILENLVELQKVHTNLAEKFDKLSEQITSLLGLFESAARSFGEQPNNKVAEKDKEFLEKVDKLLEQNKLIAKGLTIVEERMREKVYGLQARPRVEEEKEDNSQLSARPLPRF